MSESFNTTPSKGCSGDCHTYIKVIDSMLFTKADKVFVIMCCVKCGDSFKIESTTNGNKTGE